MRFIGITSHTLHAPAIHLHALKHFDFDSVLLPCNYMLMQNPAYAADFEALLKVCKAKNVAFQMIKTLQRRPYGDGPRTHATWYQPFDTQPEVDLAIHWALAQAGRFHQYRRRHSRPAQDHRSCQPLPGQALGRADGSDAAPAGCHPALAVNRNYKHESRRTGGFRFL